MSAQKPPLPTKLLWMDLEMTGLDPAKDLILEVAAEVTDFDFTILASYEARVQHDTAMVKKRMDANQWWQDFPANRDDFIAKLPDGKPLKAVEADLLAIIDAQFKPGDMVVLAGNSIHQDRKFIHQWWPNLDARLYYRMFDVTSLKIFMQGKHKVEYQKEEVHRAFDDIHESMAEWQYYLKWLAEHKA